MITEAIILAGGLGTRLRTVVNDLPKCMANINSKPFLDYVINYAKSQGIEKIILSIGYKSEFIKEYYSKNQFGISIIFSEENEPFGTGGAVILALQKTITENVLVTNGDTLYEFELTELNKIHQINNAMATLCLQPMQNFERYGVVKTTAERITSFEEKKYYENGLINAGVYLLNKKAFNLIKFPQKFSLEKDFFESHFTTKKIYASVQNNYFIDIGIPEDYTKAQNDFKNKF